MSMIQEANEITESSTLEVNDGTQMDETVNQKESMANEMVGVSNGECEPASIAKQARDWFTKLSSEERSGATSFSDGAFLGTFLALASPWSKSTNVADFSGSGGPTKGNTWDTMVSIREFEMKYYEIESSLKETPKLANRKSTESCEIDELAEADQNIIEADEFRIRNLAEPEMALNVLQDESMGSSLDYTPINAALLRRQIFEEAVLIFPCVFKNIAGTEERTPHIVIRPSYFDNASDEEQFLAFTAHMGNQDSFLSCNFRPANTCESSWWRRISPNTDYLEDTVVPLSSFLTARFEWAAWESFLEFEFNKTDSVDGEMPDGKAMDCHSRSKNHLLSILGDILSHSRAVNDLSLTIDSATLSHFAAPLFDISLLWDCGADRIVLNNFENIILTPLSWILSAVEASSSVNLHDIDEAIDLSLQRMDKHKPEEHIALGSTSDDGGGASDDLVVPKRTNDNTSQTKKKKKNKKKKNKKSTNIQSPNISVDHDELPAILQDVDKSSSRSHVVEISVSSRETLDGTCDDNAKLDPIDDEYVADSLDVASTDSDDTVDDLSLLRRSFADVNVEKNDDGGKVRLDSRTAIPTPFGNDMTVAPSVAASTENATSAESVLSNSDWDSWETVEVRGRGSRRKQPPPPPPPPLTANPAIHTSSVPFPTSETQGKNKQGKFVRSTTSPRKKVIARNIVREILSSVIDSIDDESRKLRQPRIVSPAPTMNSWKNGPPGVSQKDFHSVVSRGSEDVGKSEPTMCDIVTGKRAESFSPSAGPTILSCSAEGTITAISLGFSKDGKSSLKTDQNTAPTYQDSASSSSNPRLDSKEEPEEAINRKCDASSSDNEAPQNGEGDLGSKYDTVDSLTPPLPTLLTPENANSATSSVASSLEAPHRVRPHHHSDVVPDVNDVGYHLLDVCDRLSRDMSLFMSRRALALSARRRERGAIVSALQSSVSSIWPGQSHVELYGSCATQLDLPSSDIDVVVLGLNQQSYLQSSVFGANQLELSNSDLDATADDTKDIGDTQQANIHPLVPSASFGMLPHHRNAERVVRLAADLEKQAWAVQVNAIPTASVPVIKVLADPSKLLLASNGTDWMTQHQRLAGQAATAAGGVGSFESRPNPEYSKADSGSYPPPTHVPWRGSDVMKGLLSLDITFEGPEHGGIGSTEFSSQTVADACAEAGLDPDATPFVQTLMVLKELLAQRKLNEPYSGGLSSYALLLLVLALVRERAVIREEIALVEQQKRAMAVEDPGTFTPVPSHTTPSKPTEKRKSGDISAVVQDAVKNENPRSTHPITKASSWATIAKGNAGSATSSVAVTTKTRGVEVKTPKNRIPESPPKKPSFADAVSGAKRPALSMSSSASRTMGTSLEVTPDAKQKPSERATTSDKKSVASRTSEPSVSPIDSKIRAPAFYPQGYNDIVEVLCSGEITAGKLLMHFLLYYGQHFDAQSTAIDISGKHERQYDGQTPLNSYISPYIQRQSLGNIDPITGMLTVDPIVIYDPLEGAENNNVARRCFAWNSVRWIFAQSYATLASAVERSATPPTTPSGGPVPQALARDCDADLFSFHPDGSGDLMDPSSPLLRCLLSF